jgi:hypothetical protein
MDLISISNEIWIKHRDAGGAVAFLVHSNIGHGFIRYLNGSYNYQEIIALLLIHKFSKLHIFIIA